VRRGSNVVSAVLFESATREMEKKEKMKEHGSEGGKGCDWEGA
jgi:hypothetical protein